jgi:Flp pilus assembly pilin Flp
LKGGRRTDVFELFRHLMRGEESVTPIQYFIMANFIWAVMIWGVQLLGL